ncbi:hypothetical protein I8J29_09685 [Paenibacillus sp. MWE-103]|uniref:Uncharacterized protein n=1 Tax=Paenibacillus artemisiicola TaxID=1172618 RepID=A0ABS3W828_9BACL|nr:hypothetical protein [Paenibacillus artemisiicola]MBO7744466.1 hypothetical protein [Paenibacillus artemisiicola]
MLYKDGSGTIRDKKVWGELLENSPVYLSGSATNYPFVTILLNEKLMKGASYAEVTFRDGTKVTKKFSKSIGLIVPYGRVINGDMQMENVLIYNNSNSVIYNKATQ